MAARDRGKKLFDPGGDAVTALFMADHILVGDVIELDDPARADERMMAVPGIGRDFKGDEGALIGGDFGDDIF